MSRNRDADVDQIDHAVEQYRGRHHDPVDAELRQDGIFIAVGSLSSLRLLLWPPWTGLDASGVDVVSGVRIHS